METKLYIFEQPGDQRNQRGIRMYVARSTISLIPAKDQYNKTGNIGQAASTKSDVYGIKFLN